MTSTNKEGDDMDDKMKRQLELEHDMVLMSVEKSKSAWDRAVKKGTQEDTAVGNAFTKHCITEVSRVLRVLIADQRKGCAGRGSRSIALMKTLKDIDTAAFLGCKGAFHAIITESKYTYACLQVGGLLEDQAYCEAYEDFLKKSPLKQEKYRLKNTLKGLDSRGVTSRKNRKAQVRKSARVAKFEWKGWSQIDKIRVGDVILEIFKNLGFFEIIKLPGGKTKRGVVKTPICIQPTQKLNEWVDAGKVAGPLLHPTRLPMLVPPKRRTGKYLKGSGYFSGAVRERAVIKNPRANSKRRLAQSNLSVLKECLVTLDETAFVIDRRVLEALEKCWEMGIEMGELPKREPKELPKKPRNIAKMAQDDPVKIAYKREAKIVHEYNHRMISKKLLVQRIIDLARMFKDEPEIYFPHDIDFRGRVYDIPTGLSPQGPDYSRGLLKFAEGKPVRDEASTRWLMIHGANCWGYDKVSMDDRVQWVRENYERIKATAEDPWADYWWTEADKPFCFLQWVFDFIGVTEEGKDSHIAVAMDGSCNGLQHLSAMLLDPVGGEAVNLVPSDVPSDIYQRVADVVIEDLKDMQGDWVAETWLKTGWIDRKLTKRATMVMPYGGKMKSTMDYVQEAIAAKMGDAPSPFGDDHGKASAFLGKMVYQAVRKVVIKADEAMQWMQTCAGVFAKANLPLVWTTPTGLKCCQEYFVQEDMIINTFLNGKIIKPFQMRKRMAIYTDGDTLSASDMKSSVSPNFVHSMDASALLLTVVESSRQDITSFQMIHDSYGTHAADSEKMAEILRGVFVSIYRDGDVLNRFRDEMLSTLPEEYHSEIPEVPECGLLDIENVRHSEFFFA